MSVTVNKTRLPGSVIKTASGAVASVSDARMRGAIGVEASFEPRQDLHGYANPWVAGAGKNKWKASFPPDVLGTYAGWYIPWTSKLNVTIHDKGNGADISGLYFGVSDTGTYTPVRWLVSNGIVQVTHLYYENLPTSQKHYIAIYQNRETSLQKFLNRFDVMVTIDADAKNENQPYEPYENLCPISGITSASAWADPQYGGLVDWNQTIYNGNFADASRWVVAPANSGSLSVSGNIATVTPLPDSNTYTSVYGTQYTSIYITSGHKYLYTSYMRTGEWPESGNKVIVTYGGYWIKTITAQMPVNEWVEISGVWNCPTGGNTAIPSIRKYKDANLTSFEVKEFMVFDLTQMFGATKADEIYALEVATPGAGVAWFKSLFPKTYYVYDIGGTLRTVSAVNGDPHNVTAQLGETRYGGTYDFVRGKLTLTMRMVDLGSLSWGAYSASFGKCYYATPSGGKYRFAGVCSSYRQNQVNYYNLANGEFCTSSGAGYSIFVRDDRYPDVTGAVFKAAVSGVQLCYELATPIVIDMTPAEFELFHRQNYVWSDVGDTKLTYAAIHEHGG